jgi:cystathionine beta-lyase
VPQQNFDTITDADLLEMGSAKWTTFPETIGAFVAEMDFGLAPAVSGALKAALDRGLTGYLPPQVARDMSVATAAWYTENYGWNVPADRVHHVPDVMAAFDLAIEKFTKPGSAVIVPTPAYMPFLFVPKLHGREVIEVPSIEVDGRMMMDLEAIGQAFDDGAGLVVLCNPHNPLGTVFRREELIALADVVSAKDGRVFSDEIHAPIVYSPGRHIPYASVSEVAASHTITAASASKAWNLAGLKCAQVILSNDTDAQIWESPLGFWIGHGTSTLGGLANTAAYSAGGQWLGNVVEYLDGNRRLLLELVSEHLPRARMLLPEGTYIALIDFRAYGLDGDLGEWFRDNARVAMTDGAACGEASIGHARFVFALPRPLLREAVVRIAKALDAHTAERDAVA